MQINTSDISICTDFDRNESMKDEENGSVAIEKYKQRLILKESLLHSFTNGSSYSSIDEFNYNSNNNKQSMTYDVKNMPAYMYAYKYQYILLPNDQHKKEIIRFYDEILLLNDIIIPNHLYLSTPSIKQLQQSNQSNQSQTQSNQSQSNQSKFNHASSLQTQSSKQQQQQYSKVNLISVESVWENIYKKIVDQNNLYFQQQYQGSNSMKNQQNLNGQQQLQQYKRSKKQQRQQYNQYILKSQYCMGLKFLVQQYKSCGLFILINLIIGISMVTLEIFLMCLTNVFDEKRNYSNNGSIGIMNQFDLIAGIYFMIVFNGSLFLLFQSTARSSNTAVKYNKYLSFCFLMSSLIHFAVIFLIDSQKDIQILSIFSSTYIIIFIVHTFQSIKLFNLYHRLEVLLGIKTRKHLLK